MYFGDVFDDFVVFGCSGDVDLVGFVFVDVWFVWWYW